MEFSFIDQEEVEFDNQIFKGTGRIVGCADMGSPAICQFYLIQVSSLNTTFPNDAYPFTVIVVHQLFLRPLQ